MGQGERSKLSSDVEEWEVHLSIETLPFFPFKKAGSQQKSGKIGPIKEGSQAAAHLPMYHTTEPSKPSRKCLRPQEDHNEKGHQPETKNGLNSLGFVAA